LRSVRFCGSGSTLASVQELERRSIGIDIDAGHCRTARKRLMIRDECLAAAA
jgi:DNA modification methylase